MLSTKNVTLLEFSFPDVSFAHTIHVLLPSPESRLVTLSPHVMDVFVVPESTEYQQLSKAVSSLAE